MKRNLAACAVALFGLAGAGTAFGQADPWLVLVTGMDVITFNGTTVTCSTNGGASTTTCPAGWGVSTGGTNTATGTYDLTASNFGGWEITGDTGQTQTTSCTPFCQDQTQIDLTGGGSSLYAYFGAGGYTTEPGVVDTQSVSINTGGFTSTGYYTVPATDLTSIGYAAGKVPNLSSWTTIGSTMTFPSNDITTQSTSAGISNSFNLTSELVLSPGGTYSVTDTITATPEPASVMLFCGVLALAFVAIRRKVQNA